MQKSLYVGILALGLLFSGLILLVPGFLSLALILMVYILYGYWNSTQDITFDVKRILSVTRIAVGGDIMVELSLQNKGGDCEEVLIEDILPDGLKVIEGSNKKHYSLNSGQVVSWQYRLNRERGFYLMRGVKITVHDHLGISVSQKIFATEERLFILPNAPRLRQVAILPRRTRVYAGSVPVHQGGSGIEFAGVREYQMGDSPRWINWKASARHQYGLFSNDYEQERVADIGIILDGRSVTNEFQIGRSLFEYSTLVAASLSDALLYSGNRVGLLFIGKQTSWTSPGYGKIQRERILHDLARYEIEENKVFTEITIPTHYFPSRSQLILISPLNTGDFQNLTEILSKGYNLLVVSPDPVSFEMSGLNWNDELITAERIVHLQRRIFLQRLRSAGIRVVNWDVKQSFEQVARQELERPISWLRAINRNL